MLASGLFFIAPAIANALFAEGAHHPENVRRDVRRAARHIAMLAGPAALFLVLAGPTILGIFGEDYADEGSTLLLILVGSALFDAGFQLCMAYLRIRGRLREAAIATWSILVLTISATWLLLPPLGLEGAGVGWAAGRFTGLCVALVLLARGRDYAGDPRRAASASS